MNNLKYLIGKTEENEYIFVNIRLGKTLGISLDVVSPMIVTNALKMDLIESLLSSIDKDTYINLLEEYDVKPSELDEILFDNMDISELVDNSLYDEEFYIDNNYIIMESVSCGQCKEYLNKINKSIYNNNFIEYISNIWNKYHLKEINDTTKKEIENNIINYINDIDYTNEYNWIEKQLKNNF